jgi:formylglycine-generating enzyme required for sulfatase activity
LLANPFGLHDTHGNVWEWTGDWWATRDVAEDAARPIVDPAGPASDGTQRVVRGGDWYFSGAFCRSSLRNSNEPAFSNGSIGFRVWLPVDAVRNAVTRAGKGAALNDPASASPAPAANE